MRPPGDRPTRREPGIKYGEERDEKLLLLLSYKEIEHVGPTWWNGEMFYERVYHHHNHAAVTCVGSEGSE